MRPEPGISTVNTVEVASIDGAVEKIEANGGEVVMPKTEIPGVGFHAY